MTEITILHNPTLLNRCKCEFITNPAEEIYTDTVEYHYILPSHPNELLHGFYTQYFHVICGKTIERKTINLLKKQSFRWRIDELP